MKTEIKEEIEKQVEKEVESEFKKKLPQNPYVRGLIDKIISFWMPIERQLRNKK